jgi:outer membrane lipoprotein-sorting protein
MKEVISAAILLCVFLSSCVQGGYNRTYIISEQSKEEAPSYIEEAL